MLSFMLHGDLCTFGVYCNENDQYVDLNSNPNWVLLKLEGRKVENAHCQQGAWSEPVTNHE